MPRHGARNFDEDFSDDDYGSDHDEFIVHQEGNEEIHITRKAKKQLKSQVAHFKVVKHYSAKPAQQIDEQPFDEDNFDENDDGQKSSELSYNFKPNKKQFLGVQNKFKADD